MDITITTDNGKTETKSWVEEITLNMNGQEFVIRWNNWGALSIAGDGPIIISPQAQNGVLIKTISTLYR